MLGRFLELSLPAPDVAESLAFYESLGFTQATTGDIWSYPYAVVTDGHVHIGLHQEKLAAPAITFVQAELAGRLPQLRDLGIEFEFERLGDEVFNEAGFRDPHGVMIRLLEARTFSPPDTAATGMTACGYFAEFALPVRSFDAGREFWEPLGFVAFEPVANVFPHITLTSDHLNIALYRTRVLRSPALSFEASDAAARIAALRERGFEPGDELPDGLDPATNASLVAPEGTRLLILQAED
jgi:catechol 2,3-dioxygenase-like lactoylglutathione lyase family enzyme